MREKLELPQLSLNERDRRWNAVREEMRKNELDALLVCGLPSNWDFTVANARFLTQIGGNAEFNYVVFPLEGEVTCFVLMPTFVEYWKRAQNWVSDIRARKGTWAEGIVSRFKELGLEKKRIGVDGLASALDPDGWFPYSVYSKILDLMPEATFVNLNDLLERVRMVKSQEEIDLLERAARLGDRMLETIRTVARPGVKETEIYGKVMEIMLAYGGEEPTLFLWASDAHPLPHPFRLPTARPLSEGDLIICEMHPKYGGYFTHVERTFSLGNPEAAYLKIYEGCIEAYHRAMEMFLPGKSISAAMNAIKELIATRGLAICEAGIHGHGLSSLDYPRYRHHTPGADEKSLELIGDQFKPGMVFAFNIDLVDPHWRNGKTGCVFAETILITEKGCRRMHSFDINFQIIE